MLRTRAGLVVVRDAATLEIRARYLGESPATSVAVAGGVVWLAFKNGEVGRFDPLSGGLSPAVDSSRANPDPLVYLGNGAGSPIAVFETGTTRRGAHFRIVNLGTATTQRLRYRSARQNFGQYGYPPSVGVAGGQMLLSWDWGEFGGDTALVDLAEGTARSGLAGGSLGFAEIGGRPNPIFRCVLSPCWQRGPDQTT